MKIWKKWNKECKKRLQLMQELTSLSFHNKKNGRLQTRHIERDAKLLNISLNDSTLKYLGGIRMLQDIINIYFNLIQLQNL